MGEPQMPAVSPAAQTQARNVYRTGSRALNDAVLLAGTDKPGWEPQIWLICI
jgi:hypothetical protein